LRLWNSRIQRKSGPNHLIGDIHTAEEIPKETKPSLLQKANHHNLKLSDQSSTKAIIIPCFKKNTLNQLFVPPSLLSTAISFFSMPHTSAKERILQ